MQDIGRALERTKGSLHYCFPDKEGILFCCHERAQPHPQGGALRTAGAEIVRLLDLHFAKEEDILFPMARQLLSRQALEEVARRFEALEGG